MKSLSLVLLAWAASLGSPLHAADRAPKQETEETQLPIGPTEEEKTRQHEIGARHLASPPPIGTVRNPGEWEPSEGVLVRWPLGIGVGLVREMAEDVVVTTIVADAAAEQSARKIYAASGVNMAHVAFVYAPTDSIWVRDYGPWFIFDDDQLAIVDHIYNRARPLDDVVPQAIGTAWGLNVFGMDLVHSGGNYMSDGLGTAASSDLVYGENSSKTHAAIDQIILDYLGNDYTVVNRIQAGGIHHIDCWAKFLGPSTVMVKDVPPSDPTWDDLDAQASFFAQKLSPWSVPYKVVRVFCPAGTYYTNSLILNNKVLVPLFNNPQDAVAMQTYRDAMPGYEVIGFAGGWSTEDALHCRTMGVPDRAMLSIDHVPLRTDDLSSSSYEINSTIVARSGSALLAGQLNLHYRSGGGPWQVAPLFPGTGPNAFVGTIPPQAEDTEVAYYLEAADGSGRSVTHPAIGEPWAHHFTAACPSRPVVDVTPNGPLLDCTGGTRLLTVGLTGGTGPFTYQWIRDGAEVPGATSSTYLAQGAGPHQYACRVWGAGCVNPRTDPEPVSLTWQSQPAFGGLAALTNSQSGTCALDLSWAPAVAACGGPARYSVYRSTTAGFVPGPQNLLVQGLVSSTFHDASELSSSTSYHYVVRARDESNGVEDSNTVQWSRAPTGPPSGTQTLFTETFEDAANWSLWQVTTGPGPHTCGSWARVNTDTQRPPGSTGFYALANSDACGAGGTTSTILTSPAIDGAAPGIVSVTLEYDVYYRYYNGDNTTVEVWDGSGWQVVWTAPGSNVQAHHTINVTPWATGNPAFRVRFSYQEAGYDWWFALDNVKLTAQIGGVCATSDAAVSRVPDGSQAGTHPLRAWKAGGGIQLSWDVATTACASTDYHLIWGRGSDVGSHAIAGADCTLNASGSHLWTTAPDSSSDWAWFLVVGNDGASTEGSWGVSSVSERSTVPSGQCGMQALSPGACP